MIPDGVLHEFYCEPWAGACLHLSGQAVKLQESVSWTSSLLLAGMCLWLLVSYLPWMKSLHSSKMGHMSWMTVTRVWWQPTRCRSIFTKQQHSQLQLAVAGWCISWLQWLIQYLGAESSVLPSYSDRLVSHMASSHFSSGSGIWYENLDLPRLPDPRSNTRHVCLPSLGSCKYLVADCMTEMAGKWMWSCVGLWSGFSSVASYWACWSNWPWAKCRKERLSAILILHMASVAALSVIKLPLRTFMACSVQTLACRSGITVALAPASKCLEKDSFRMLYALWRKGLRLPECLPSQMDSVSALVYGTPLHVLHHTYSPIAAAVGGQGFGHQHSQNMHCCYSNVSPETPVTDQWLVTLWWNISQKVPQASVMLSLPSVGFSGG